MLKIILVILLTNTILFSQLNKYQYRIFLDINNKFDTLTIEETKKIEKLIIDNVNKKTQWGMNVYIDNMYGIHRKDINSLIFIYKNSKNKITIKKIKIKENYIQYFLNDETKINDIKNL
jgi:hypothetical protein